MIPGQFLQTKEWMGFQESLGRKTWRIDGVLVIKMPLKFGLSYLYCPKTNYKLRITNDEFIKKIKETARKEKSIFFRCEPPGEPPKNFKKTRDIQPPCTQILDLTKSEEKLLAEMHQKTRYNIRLAERKKLRITNYEPCLPADKLLITNKKFEEFYNLLEKTSARQKIRLHSKEYYKKLLNHYNNLCGRTSYCNELFIAYYSDVPVAAAMINFFEDTATYLHGGSSDEQKNLMAPYLLHWGIIKTAKAQGMKFYDWWGVDEKKWPGLTRFKKGFGGEEVRSPGAYDLPINKFWYFWYKLFKK